MGFGILPLGVRGSTLLGNEVRMQFITGSVHGIWFLPLGIWEANTALH